MDADNTRDAREMDEQELSQVSGAGRGFNAECPKCGCEKYTHTIIEANGTQVLARKCDGCGNVYR